MKYGLFRTIVFIYDYFFSSGRFLEVAISGAVRGSGNAAARNLFISLGLRMNMITHKDDVKPIDDPCGELRELYQSDTLGIAHVIFSPKSEAKLHLHRVMEEVYYITKGKGKIVIGDKEHDIREGDTVAIPKNVPHKAINPNDEVMEALVVTHPKFMPEDLIMA